MRNEKHKPNESNNGRDSDNISKYEYNVPLMPEEPDAHFIQALLVMLRWKGDLKPGHCNAYYCDGRHAWEMRDKILELKWFTNKLTFSVSLLLFILTQLWYCVLWAFVTTVYCHHYSVITASWNYPKPAINSALIHRDTGAWWVDCHLLASMVTIIHILCLIS